MENFINGTVLLFSNPTSVLIFLGGLFGGMIFGAIPGVSMLTLAAILLPFGITVVGLRGIWVDAGSADESFHTGIAHLFEHMMFKGSKNIGEEVHAQLINERGGRINAYTNRATRIRSGASLDRMVDTPGHKG